MTDMRRSKRKKARDAEEIMDESGEAADVEPVPRARPLYTLTVAAQLVGLAPRTIRAYEEAGLIAPARVGRNRQRLYSPQDLRWLRCIYEMLHYDGYTLRSIRRLLDFAPCWEIRRCPEEVARRCAQALRIPSSREDEGAGGAERSAPSRAAPASGPKAPVHIKLIYGIEEFGTVMHCLRCIRAERVVRRVAAEFGDLVEVSKHDILSEEASRYGVLMTPAIVINDEVVSVGKGLSENHLRQLISQFLRDAKKTSRR